MCQACTSSTTCMSAIEIGWEKKKKGILIFCRIQEILMRSGGLRNFEVDNILWQLEIWYIWFDAQKMMRKLFHFSIVVESDVIKMKKKYVCVYCYRNTCWIKWTMFDIKIAYDFSTRHEIWIGKQQQLVNKCDLNISASFKILILHIVVRFSLSFTKTFFYKLQTTNWFILYFIVWATLYIVLPLGSLLVSKCKKRLLVK